MLKTVIKAIFAGRSRPKNYQQSIRDEMLSVSQKAKAITEEFERKIDATKEALVHLVGEYAISMTEMNEQMKKRDDLSSAIDKALIAGNDNAARLSVIERATIDHKIESCHESINILIPKIRDLYKKKVSLVSSQADAIHKSGMMEARARSSEAIGRAQEIIGSSNIEGIDLGIESLNASVEKLDAYEKAITEVRGDSEVNQVDEPISRFDSYDEVLEKRRRELNIEK